MRQSSRTFNDDEDLLDLGTTISSRLERLVRNSLLLLIALTVLAFGTVEYWAIAIFALLVIVLFLIWGGLEACRPHSRLLFPVILAPLLLAILYGLLQGVAKIDRAGRHWALSMDPEATLLVVEVLALLLIAGLMIANVFRTRHRLLILRNFLIIFGLIYALFALINHFTWNGRYFWVIEPTVEPSHPFGSFVNHNHFAGFMEMIAPLPLALIVTRTVRGELALLNGLAAVVMSMATILSLSRGGMVSLLAGLMFVVFLGLRPAQLSHQPGLQDRIGRIPLALTRLGAVLTILATLTIGILWVGADSVIERLDLDQTARQSSLRVEDAPAASTSAFYQSRGFIWEDTIRMIRANWLTGVGLGAYQTVYPLYTQRDRYQLVGQAHNDYLQVLADGGVILGLVALLFLALLLRHGHSAVNHPDPVQASLAIGCSGGLFALLVHSLFDFNLQLVSNSLLFITLSMVVWRIGYSARNRRVSPGLIPLANQIDVDGATLRSLTGLSRM